MISWVKTMYRDQDIDDRFGAELRNGSAPHMFQTHGLAAESSLQSAPLLFELQRPVGIVFHHDDRVLRGDGHLQDDMRSMILIFWQGRRSSPATNQMLTGVVYP